MIVAAVAGVTSYVALCVAGALRARARRVRVLRAIPCAPQWAFGLEIAERAGVGRGAIYVDLALLQEHGLIRRGEPEPPAREGMIARRPYQLTDKGRELVCPARAEGPYR